MEHDYYAEVPGRIYDETPTINAELAKRPGLRVFVEWGWNAHAYAALRYPKDHGDELVPEHLDAYGSGITTRAALLDLERSLKENS